MRRKYPDAAACMARYMGCEGPSRWPTRDSSATRFPRPSSLLFLRTGPSFSFQVLRDLYSAYRTSRIAIYALYRRWLLQARRSGIIPPSLPLEPFLHAMIKLPVVTVLSVNGSTGTWR